MPADAVPPRTTSAIAEDIRRRLADAWGDMGAAWGVAPGDRSGPRLPDDPPGAPDRTGGPRGARPVASRCQPRACRSGVVGSRRARLGATADWPARARRHGLPGRRRPLALVRSGRGRAQGPRRRPDHRGPGAHVGEAIAAATRIRTTRSSSGSATGSRRSSCSCGCSIAPSASCRASSRGELERALRLLGEVPDETVLRLVKLLEGLRDDDVLELVEALSRLSTGHRAPRHETHVRGRADRHPLGLRSVLFQVALEEVSAWPSPLRGGTARINAVNGSCRDGCIRFRGLGPARCPAT